MTVVRLQTPRSRRCGFTLVELLCVTALMAVAAAIVTVRLAGSTGQARLRAARLESESTLRRARQFTASRHRPAWLEIDCEQRRIRAAFAKPEGIVGTWKSLDRVRVTDVEIGDSVVRAGEPVRIRVTTAGITLPWRA